MALTGPFSVEYPVNFYSGGDTTKEAFGKHIQEIQRIYGLINSLNADKVSASEVTNLIQPHINSTDPHPNWIIDLSKTTGNLAASRLSGTLSSSVIPTLSTSKISGLENYIKTISKNAVGETMGNATYLYVGDILLQWGKFQIDHKVTNVDYDVTIPLTEAYRIFDFNHYNSNGVLQKTTHHALYVTEVYKVANGVDGVVMSVDVHDDYTIEQGKTDLSFVVTVKLNSGGWEEGAYLMWNTWGIKGPEVTLA